MHREAHLPGDGKPQKFKGSIMTHQRRRNTFCLVLLVVLTLVWAIFAGPLWGATLIYKNYMIRRDGNRDIFCEPHVVRPNEYVLKIFRHKGEIAHRAFGEFLSIFKRLNPHIADVDKLHPGQLIFIPLKILSPGDFAGRTSDFFTIPFVTISQNDARLKRFTKKYVVRPGDFVSKLVARDFGRYGSRTYQQGFKLFKLLNGDIDDLNHIMVGQQIKLVDPAIRRQPWYETIFDRQMARLQPALKAAGKSYRPPGKTDVRPVDFILEQLASVFGGRLARTGKYHFPTKNQGRFTVDLAHNPMLYIGKRAKILFVKSPLSDLQLISIRKSFKNLAIIVLTDASAQKGNEAVSVAQPEALLDAVFTHLGATRPAVTLTKTIDGIGWEIRPQWILATPPNDLQALKGTTVTLLDNPLQRISKPVVRYLAGNGVTIRELVRQNSANNAFDGPELRPEPATQNDNSDTATDSPVSIRHILSSMGYRLTPDVSIHFPYAGIQITARSNLVTADNMPPLFVDFGELYGEAIDAIEKAGFRMLHFGRRDPAEEIVPALLRALGIDFIVNPEFAAAKRPQKYNALFTVPGYLLKETKPKKILIALVPVRKTISALLNAQGITVYTIRQPVRL